MEQKLVGWDSSLHTGYRDAYLEYVERYPRLSDVAVVGDALRDSVSAEAVLDLQPDLVIMNEFMLGRGLDFVERLEQAGVPMLFISSADPIRDPQRSVRLLGKVLGREKRAREVVQFIDSELDKVFGQLAAVEGPEPSVYVEVMAGLSEYGQTYGHNPDARNTGWGGMLAPLRCRNIAAGVVPTTGKISPEYLLHADPDLIIMLGAYWVELPHSLRLGYHADTGGARERLVALKQRPGWEQLTAVQEDRLRGLHMRFVGHVTAFAAVLQLAQWLYPEKFQYLDPEASLREFHRRFLPVEFRGTWMVSVGDE